MYKNLQQYIDRLRAAGELIEIETPVDPILEICEITDRVSKQPGGGKAVLFKNTGTDFSVLTNMMGSDSRICMALGVEHLDEVKQRIEKMFEAVSSPKNTFRDKVRLLPVLGEIARCMPHKSRSKGKCQQVVDREPNLAKLPILKCWPHDGGSFVTLPLVHTVDPESGAPNTGMYRMQVFSENSTGMHWHPHKTGARHYEQYKKLGRRMPVSVALGGDPIYTYSATAPLPDGIDEYMLAGFVRRRAVKLVKCITNDLYIPSDCDFVIEGYVDPAEPKVVEGPFGDHTGFYSLEDLFPTFHVTCITHRRDAVYPATIVGIPPQEDAYIAKATERIFLAPIRIAMLPEIKDLWMPEQGTAHNIAIASIEKSYAGQPFKAASAMWGAGQMMFNKFFGVFDSNTDIRNLSSLGAAFKNVSIPRDVMFSKGPLDILDHTSDVCGYGGKLAVDFTGTPEPSEIIIPKEWEMTDNIEWINAESAEVFYALFLGIEKGCVDPTTAATAFIQKNNLKWPKFVLLMEANAPANDISTLIWLAAANCDAVRDVKVFENTLILDATIKTPTKGFLRRFPNIVTSDNQTIEAVNLKKTVIESEQIPKESPSEKFFKLTESGCASID